MWWKRIILVAGAGVVLLEIGFWPASILVFACVILSLGAGKADSPLRPRVMLGVALVALSAAAFSSHGEASPWMLLACGGAALAWPLMLRTVPLTVMVAEPGSVLLRSKRNPLRWAAVAELKPGAEPFPRSISSFSGNLLVFASTGRTYAVSRCSALGKSEAERKLLTELRSCAAGSGALLLPLDSAEATEVMGWRLSRGGRGIGQGWESGSWCPAEGLIAVDVRGERVEKFTAFGILPERSACRLPAAVHPAGGRPLAWEVFEALGKRVRWPEPDSLSDLVHSLSATKGVPVSERIAELGGSGDGLKLKSLSGQEVGVSRPQLRALLSMYA